MLHRQFKVSICNIMHIRDSHSISSYLNNMSLFILR